MAKKLSADIINSVVAENATIISSTASPSLILPFFNLAKGLRKSLRIMYDFTILLISVVTNSLA